MKFTSLVSLLAIAVASVACASSGAEEDEGTTADLYITNPYDTTKVNVGEILKITWDQIKSSSGLVDGISTVSIDLMDGPNLSANVILPIASGLSPAAGEYAWKVDSRISQSYSVFIRMTGISPVQNVIYRFSHRFTILNGNGHQASSSSDSSSNTSSSSSSGSSSSDSTNDSEQIVVVVRKPVSAPAPKHTTTVTIAASSSASASSTSAPRVSVGNSAADNIDKLKASGLALFIAALAAILI